LLRRFAFDDCLLIDLIMTNDISSITVVSEAWFPLESGQTYRTKGRIRLRLSGAQEIQLHVKPGFFQDRTFSNDRRGNEVYRFECLTDVSNRVVVSLYTDLLVLDGTFQGGLVDVT
jgi:hypothetical protein